MSCSRAYSRSAYTTFATIRKRQRFDASRAQTGSDIRRGAAHPVQRRLGHDALEAPQMLMPLSVA
jgi:hypothetical protein